MINHAAPSQPKDLEQHNCLIYKNRQRNYSRWAFKNDNEDFYVNVNGNYRVDLAEAIRDAAISGWGIAYLATYLLTDEFKTGQLIQLLPQWQASQVMRFWWFIQAVSIYPRKLAWRLNSSKPI